MASAYKAVSIRLPEHILLEIDKWARIDSVIRAEEIRGPYTPSVMVHV